MHRVLCSTSCKLLNNIKRIDQGIQTVLVEAYLQISVIGKQEAQTKKNK